MDPIYQQVNQNRMLENTQRSSDNLRMQQNKETKRRSERAGEVAQSDDSTELSLMSDDMLGDMDPDMFGGGGKGYRRAWEEESDEAPDENHQEGEDSEESGQQSDTPEDFQEGQPSESLAPTEDGQQPEDPGDQPEGQALERPPQSPSSAEKPAPDKNAQTPTEKPTATSIHKAAPADHFQPNQSSKSQTVNPAEEKTPPPEVPAAPATDSLLGQTHNDFGVYFDASQGFLIAEEYKAQTGEATEEAAIEEAPAVSPDLQELLDTIIVGDGNTLAYRRLQSILSRFGRGVLQLCSRHGTKVFLLPRGTPLSDHPLLSELEDDPVDAAYIFSQKAVVVECQCLEQAPELFSPVILYFAYAFDHALGGEEYASTRAPAVRCNFEVCQEGGTLKSPHRFSDTLAAISPVHFFAQAVESYLSENDCHNPMWTRQELYDFDRSMYEYTDYLFRRQNKT